MAGNPPDDRAEYRPHYSSVDGTTSAHEYAKRSVDSPVNNHERTVRKMQEIGGPEPTKWDVHVWGHGDKGPKYLGSWDRVVPHETKEGQRGVMLQSPAGGPAAKFMPNESVHAITHKPIK